MEDNQLERSLAALKAQQASLDDDSAPYASIIQALAAAIDAQNPVSQHHSQAVSDFAAALAREIHLPEEQIDVIRYAGLLHDIGKIGIPDFILFKPAPLTPAEWAIVQTHPQLGVSILAGAPQMQELLPLVRHHHERYDGEGYPDGLHSEGIPLGARILCIAEAFDVMTCDQVYRQALSMPEAIAVLEREAGGQFDPDLVQVFVQMIRRKLD